MDPQPHRSTLYLAANCHIGFFNVRIKVDPLYMEKRSLKIARPP